MSDSTPPKRNSKIQLAAQAYPALQMPLGYEEICSILPHRYPFLLVDRIVEMEPGHRCVGIKNVTANEEFFQGHFPDHPVMPGVLILEAMAQVAGVLTLVSRNTPGALSYFAAIEKARFRQPLRPGDQLVTEATLQVLRGALCKVSVVGRVDGQVAVEADYTFMTADDAASAMVQGAASQKRAPVVPPLVAPVGAAVPHTNGHAANGHAANGHVVSDSDTSHRTPLTEAPREYSGPTFIHPLARVDPGAELDEGAWIGPYCLIEGGTHIGANTVLEANVIVKRGTTVGKRCRIWPHSILGHDPQDVKFKGEESFLRVGDDNVLREMVTLHRATGEGEATVIGDSNLLMAYVHIGHNCKIGSNTMISNSTGISGHVTVEDKVVIGGFVGIHQFVHIGKMAMVGGVSKVVQDVPPFCICDGRPAKIYGLNIRGLRRNDVPPEERNQMSQAFKLLYRSDLNTTQALERIEEEIPRSETLDYLLDFIERVRVGRLGRQDETSHL
jgi:UDP-N-acetylglucosamine acyltransferase